MAAGAAVDYVIGRAMKAHRDDGEALVGLATAGVRLFRRQIQNSLAVVPEIQNGGRWDRSSGKWMPPLQHHYYGLDLGDEAVARMERRIVECLGEFESGAVWERIRRVSPAAWHPLGKMDGRDVPSFLTSCGVKVWSAVDFAMVDGDMAHVVDWKSGVPSPSAQEAARDQLAVYAMWACRHYGLRPERVQVQAVWLQAPTAWEPQTVDDVRLRSVAKRIKAEVAAEEARLEIRLNVRGRRVQRKAPRENFPPRPGTKRCVECRFRELCPEGQRECAHLQTTAALAV